MKIMALVLVSFVCANALRQGLQLTAGESYTYTFTSMEFLGFNGGTLGTADFAARFAGDLFDPGESIRMEMFEGTPQQTPFAANTFTGSGASLDLLSFGVPQIQPHWNDFQGAVRLTVLTGSANLARVGVFADIDTLFYGNTVAVPEPSTFV